MAARPHAGASSNQQHQPHQEHSWHHVGWCRCHGEGRRAPGALRWPCWEGGRTALLHCLLLGAPSCTPLPPAHIHVKLLLLLQGSSRCSPSSCIPPKRLRKPALKSQQHFKTPGLFPPRCCSPLLRLWSRGLLVETHTGPARDGSGEAAGPAAPGTRLSASTPPHGPHWHSGTGQGPPPGRLVVQHSHQPR